MIHSNDTTAWVWLIDQLAAELICEPQQSRTAIIARLDEAAGYPVTREDSALMPMQAKRRELVDRLIERLEDESLSQAPRTLLLNENFAKSVTLA